MKTEKESFILIIDDNPENLQVLGSMLEEQHYKSAVLKDGRKALGLVKKKLPDLILLDIMMPEMDGFEVCRQLKSDVTTKNIPVIFISALTETAEKLKGFHVGGVDYITKPFHKEEVLARVEAHLSLRYLQNRLQKANTALEARNRFIRKTFGRYLSDDVVNTILESPEGLALGGEKRFITIMMTDLRGFTPIGERLPAESVVSMLNLYLDVMTEIIFKYHGTIDEFIGDAILAVFGAPIRHDGHAKHAVACALEMQLAMEQVNGRNRIEGYPDIEMGIGINTGHAVVGNIGSSKRTKYSIIGHHVNLTSRIESYTVGGEIFISENTLKACGGMLRIDGQMEVRPKGVTEPVTIYDVGGIGGDFNVSMPEKKHIGLLKLPQSLPVEITILDGKHAGENRYPGKIVTLSDSVAEIQAERGCRELTNLKITIFDTNGNCVTKELYAKVRELLSESHPVFRVHFTSVPPEAETFFTTQIASL
ncbi:MAG: adenylate/guanylate cyclase domain-containing response regulator [bacterium]|nr:adenylate/guanylate cyclase domain-containing response regulator [bacterium]